MQKRPQIARPRVLGLTLACLAGAASLAGLGFARLLERADQAPVTVLSHSDRLGQALEKAPWVRVGGQGPVVWAVLGGPCAQCAAFAAEDLAALENEGFEVRVIYVADVGAGRAEQERAIAIARARRGDEEGPPEPGEAEGDLQWGRTAAAEIAAVLSANHRPSSLPLLIWRRGPEWRVLQGRDPHARARVAAELAPGA
ncbi:MAG: hypothetical protein AB7L65_05730 [Hyphomonadaceae bacterium]